MFVFKSWYRLLCIDSEDKRYLFKAVYGAGIIRMYELNTHTGEIIRLIQELAHDFPTGTHERQDHPHAHYINQTPDGKYVAVTDLGADRIVTYKFDDNGFEFYKESLFKDSDGTRHIEFHDNGICLCRTRIIKYCECCRR